MTTKDYILITSNTILIIAVTILFYLQFKSPSTAQQTIKKPADNTPTTKAPITNDNIFPDKLKIVYINADSLNSKYIFFKDKERDLQKKERNMKSNLENRAKSLQNEVVALQQSAATMTEAQIMSKQEALYKKQQQLLLDEQNMAQKLLKLQNDINEELYSDVSSFLKNYSQNNDYQIVLTYAKGAGVLYADSVFDVTSDVLKKLNQRYKEKKNAKN